MSEGASAPVATPVATTNTAQAKSPEVADKAPATESAPAPAEVRKLKVKVDKEELEVDESELIKGYQKAKAADKRMHEAAMLRKQAEDALKLLNENPKEALKKLKKANPKLRAALEEVLYEDIQFDGMTEEQRELHEYREREKERKAQEEQAAKEKQEAELNAKAEQIKKKWSEQFIQTLETSGLPKTEFTIARMAYYMQQGLRNGVNLDPGDVAEQVRDELMEMSKSLFASDDGSTIEKLLPDIATKLRQKDLAKLKQPATPSQNQEPRKQSAPKEMGKRKLTVEEWKRKNGL